MVNGSTKSACAVTGYFKFLLFVYIVTCPFLLRSAGVIGDTKKTSVASAAACLIGALGVGIITYDRKKDSSSRALGALLILAWLSTVVVLWRGAGQTSVNGHHNPRGQTTSPHDRPQPVQQPLPQDGELSGRGWDGTAASEDLDVTGAFEGVDIYGVRESYEDSGGYEVHEGRDQERNGDGYEGHEGFWGSSPGGGRDDGEWAPARAEDALSRQRLERAQSADEDEARRRSGRDAEVGWRQADGDGVSTESLDRIFAAPTLSEFMKPSSTGFVTAENLANVQSGSVGPAGSDEHALVPLGKGSYSAQGVIFGSAVAGACS